MIGNDYRAYVENDYNSLYHYGIKGQKWGVRRYQNEDGSLTPAGAVRYGIQNRAERVGKAARRKASEIRDIASDKADDVLQKAGKVKNGVGQVMNANMKRHKKAVMDATLPYRFIGNKVVGKAKNKLSDAKDIGTLMWRDKGKIARRKLDEAVDSNTLKLLNPIGAKIARKTLGESTAKNPRLTAGRMATGAALNKISRPIKRRPFGSEILDTIAAPSRDARRSVMRDIDMIKEYKKEIKSSRKSAKKRSKKRRNK